MSDGQVLKPDKDFSKEVDKQLPEAEQLAQVCYDIKLLKFNADIL
jgi:hypothetical protein